MKNYKDEVIGLIVNEISDDIVEKNVIKDKLYILLQYYHITKLEEDSSLYDINYNIEKFIKDKKREGCGSKTLYNYKNQLNLFAKYINKKVHEIEVDDIKDFLDHREENFGISKKNSLATLRRILKVFFDWLQSEKIIQYNPISKIKPYRTPQTIVESLTVDELEIFRESCKTLRERAIVEFLYSTGCRLSEMIQVKQSDIN